MLSRRWLVILFVATCAALASGVRPSDAQTVPTGKSTPKEAAPQPKEKAPDPDVTELKKTVADLQKTLAATAKELKDAKKGVAEAKVGSETAAKAAADATKLAGEAKAATAATSLTDALKTSIEDVKKTGDATASAAGEGKQKGDIAWMLASSALVMFMLPGLALFYGGMVRRKNVLATMMHSMAALAVVGVYWVVLGYSLAFGPSLVKMSLLGVEDGGLIGFSSDLVFLKGVSYDQMLPGYNIPVYVHVMFQGMFAIITPALISGAIAERIRFWPFVLFMLLWVTFVYCPLAHMVWAFDWFDPTVLAAKRGAGAIGLLGKMGALDFAGGTVVHIAAGMAGLAACLVLRRRDGYPKAVTHPNSMVLTLLGAGLLWFGWFGFNGGSATGASAQAASAFTATQVAAAAAGLAWMLVEWLHKGKPTALGLASGIVAGLVAVTPASGYVYAYGGLCIGVAAAVVCYGAVWLKGLLGYDDSLDAFGVHGVGGFVGAVLTGVFASTAIYPAGGDGPFAYSYHRARADELEKGLISKAKEEATAAGKKVEEAEAALKKIPADNAAAVKDAEKALTDVKDIAADKTKTADDYEAELKKLKETIAKQDDTENGGKDKKNSLSQVMIQLKAATFSVVFALVLSLLLVVLTQVLTLGRFTTDKKAEADGLDRTEHGEVGFDLGYATETVMLVSAEPRPASAPKGIGRFELTVEGISPSELVKNWSALCQPSDTPDPDFLVVYPHVTTISGTHFRCRDGDPTVVATRLERLLKKLAPGKPIKVAKV